MTKFFINKVAVLGAGVMGAQIAAHLANAKIPSILYDLKTKEGNANSLGEKALQSLQKLNPKPLAYKEAIAYIELANYEDDLTKLSNCDLIIEAIAERMELKEKLYSKIAPYINSHAIIASNTSGIAIHQLAQALPAELIPRFCGIHFFNPPRYMSLVELIPHPQLQANLLNNLESFLVSSLGKTVVIAKDTPNFIANRLGVFSMLASSIHAITLDIPFEVVDKLTGKDLGRAKSATFRTLDVVGLDTFAHVLQNMTHNCQDGFEHCYSTPKWLNNLITKGALGQKTKAGIYKKDSTGIKVLDINTMEYRISEPKAAPEIIEILRTKNWKTIFSQLIASTHPQAKFLLYTFRDAFHYAAVLLGDIADSPRAMDLALRNGFGWKQGLFEIWQSAGWETITQLIDHDFKAGKTLGKVALPQWVFRLKDGVYAHSQYYDLATDKMVSPQSLPIYSRQLFPELLFNENNNINSHILYQNEGVKLWHSGDNIGILSFKTKMCAIGMDVLTGIEQAIIVAEEKCKAMVIWQEQDIFSVGANLEEFGFAIMMNGKTAVDQVIDAGHRVITQKLRYSKIPIVAGVRGYVLGGGCEIMLHCAAVVAALESYIGLIEAGVGLLPGWGGTKEMAYRSSLAIDPWKDFERRYKNLALAQVATSAYEACEMGFLRESDSIVMNSREVLYVAKARANYMAEAGYRPPHRPCFKVFGEQGYANVQALLANMYQGKQISDHDYLIAKNIAYVMCGGEIDKNTKVSERWLLNIEKNKFSELATSDKTASRIQHMLEHGKALRN